ncbi:MAG: DHHA1 domain-containing protein, partial [Chloroflexota bacterium]
ERLSSRNVRTRRRRPDIKELTSRMPSDQIASTLAELERPFDPEFDSTAALDRWRQASEAERAAMAGRIRPTDVLLATSMLQVGVDVPRLGLMVVSGQPKVGDLTLAEVDTSRRHDIMRNHTATHLLHAALHQVLGEHARQAGSLVAPDRLRFDFNHPEAMTPEQVERVERIVNDAVAADMEVLPKLRAREDAIAEGAMALFGEKYGETVRTITIKSPGYDMPIEEAVVHPSAAAEHEHKYSYELCGGTHLERTSDVGAFLIVSEGSAAAGVRRIEAVTGRGAYDLVARRFKMLKHAASLLKSSIEDVPFKVEALQDEVSDLKKELASLRTQSALSAFNAQLANVHIVRDVNVLALEISGANADTLRALADKFREKYPQNGAAVLATGSTVIAVVTDDVTKRGLKAGDLITGIGGRGGGRPNMAQGSLPDGGQVKEALGKVPKVLEEKLK